VATQELTGETFWETVNGHEIVLVDFWAGWCGPCRRFAPVFEQASEAHPDIVLRIEVGLEETYLCFETADPPGCRVCLACCRRRSGLLLQQRRHLLIASG